MTAQATDQILRVGNRTSVLISEASMMYCDLLKRAFLAVPERFQVVACASKTSEVIALVQEHRPQRATM